MQKHIFSLYYPDFFPSKKIKIGDICIVHNARIYLRITSIIRLQQGETVIFFDRQNHVIVKLLTIFKKKLEVKIIDVQENIPLHPPISVILPLLKRNALEQSIYSMVELGAQEIQLVVTQKAQRKWEKNNERNRLEKIMISAAEQSKNYAIPFLSDPVKLSTALHNIEHPQNTVNIYADITGTPLIPYLCSINSAKQIYLGIGPEGDLTEEEKEQYRQYNFKPCSLGPTVLRASQAATVMVGICRSYFN